MSMSGVIAQCQAIRDAVTQMKIELTEIDVQDYWLKDLLRVLLPSYLDTLISTCRFMSDAITDARRRDSF